MLPVSVVPVIPPETGVPGVFPASLLTTVPVDLGQGPEPEGWHGAVPASWVPIIAR